MKKITLIIVLAFTTIAVAQEKEERNPQDVNKKHEVKMNISNVLIFEWLDFSYEYLINEESSIGIGVLTSLNGDLDLKEYRKFSLTPYYRRYFSNKFARGFFVEGFGMLHSYSSDNNFYYYENTSNHSSNRTEFAMGISAGGKFISKNGFTAEIYLGIGRNIGGDNNSLEAVGRGGISLGYRF